MFSINPKILFIRPEYGSTFSRLIQLHTEPLDLEYLAAIACQEQCEYRLFDPVVTGEKIKKTLDDFKPDIVGITGYYPARDHIIKLSRVVKEYNPDILTIIGGVHAEINSVDFYSDAVDLIVHSGGGGTFRKIIQTMKTEGTVNEINGICFKNKQGTWIRNPKTSLDLNQLPHPDRTHFSRYKNRFNYLYYGPVALVKTAYGCPYECTFCYCRLLNDGRYTTRDIDDVIDEITHICCDTIWITDDSFLIDMIRIQSFAKALKDHGVKKKFIIYSRAPFIARHPEVVLLLKEMGVVNVIVGLESVDEKVLDKFNKVADSTDNETCVRLLHENSIECTGLFIMNTDAAFNDFRKLNQWIDRVGLRLFTVSIFTPFPGTPDFDFYKNHFTTNNCQKWDLLHLVLRPENMSRYVFYLLILWTHLKVLVKNRNMLKFLFLKKGAHK